MLPRHILKVITLESLMHIPCKLKKKLCHFQSIQSLEKQLSFMEVLEADMLLIFDQPH